MLILFLNVNPASLLAYLKGLKKRCSKFGHQNNYTRQTQIDKRSDAMQHCRAGKKYAKFHIQSKLFLSSYFTCCNSPRMTDRQTDRQTDFTNVPRVKAKHHGLSIGVDGSKRDIYPDRKAHLAVTRITTTRDQNDDVEDRSLTSARRRPGILGVFVYVRILGFVLGIFTLI